MNSTLIAILVFFTLAAASAALGRLLLDGMNRGHRQARSGRAPADGQVVIKRPTRRSVDADGSGPVAAFNRWFLQLLQDSGIPFSPTSATLLVVFAAGMVGGLMFLWDDHPIVATVGAAIGTGAVLVWLVICKTYRIRRLQEQLPIALEMLARSLRSGVSLDQGIEFVGRNSLEPLATEFRRCARQLAIGGAVPSVMRTLLDRVKLADVRLLTTTLSVHRQTGGNLAKVLDRLAFVVRDRLSYRRQLRSITAGGRFSAIMVASIGPVLFAYLLAFHNHYIRAMLDSSLGQSVLILAAVMELVGLIWTARLLKPHY